MLRWEKTVQFLTANRSISHRKPFNFSLQTVMNLTDKTPHQACTKGWRGVYICLYMFYICFIYARARPEVWKTPENKGFSVRRWHKHATVQIVTKRS